MPAVALAVLDRRTDTLSMDEPCVTLSESPDWAALGAEWRVLEAEADGSFFQSWTWVGCLAEERFDAPLLLRAQRGGRTVALGLLNRRGGDLLLNESGDPVWDSLFVEHNGLLVARGEAAVRAACYRVLLCACRRLRLSGVAGAALAGLTGIGSVAVLQRRPAPYVDLRRVPAGPDGFLHSLSANTRHQLRRSGRYYAAFGTLRLRRAATVEQAQAFLDELATLHQRRWVARGAAGAFADARVRRFHTTLIARGVPRGEVDLLHAEAGGRGIGLLYNVRHGGRVSAYQGGFDYAGAGRHGKPGLTAHLLAIEAARADGAVAYDFLAGDARYKASLANAETILHWVEAAPRRSLRGLTLAAQAFARGLRASTNGGR